MVLIAPPRAAKSMRGRRLRVNPPFAFRDVGGPDAWSASHDPQSIFRRLLRNKTCRIGAAYPATLFRRANIRRA